jgi:hypothetical protein
MTVKCINDLDKRDIAKFYKQQLTIKELAQMYGYSERTIRRVLEEKSIVPTPRARPVAIPTQPSFVYKVMRFLKNLFKSKSLHV